MFETQAIPHFVTSQSVSTITAPAVNTKGNDLRVGIPLQATSTERPAQIAVTCNVY